MEIELSQNLNNLEDVIKFLNVGASVLKEQKKSILEKIQPWLNEVKSSNLSTKDKSQKRKEIIDLGNFIQTYSGEIEFLDLGESPDFLIQWGEQKIGIELSDLVIRPFEKEKEGIIKKLFSEIESELEPETVKYKGIYRISFNNENQTFKKEEKKYMKAEILESIKNPAHLRTYIKTIKKSPHSEIHLYKGEATCVGHLERNVVLEKIVKKEANFDRYVANSKFDNLWLLLVIGAVQKSDDYSFFEETIINDPFVTQFDKVFIFDFFRTEITELKTIKPNIKTA